MNSLEYSIFLVKMMESDRNISEEYAKLAPEPTFVFTRELRSADVTSHVAGLDENHFVIA